jgi:hypothetical protein
MNPWRLSLGAAAVTPAAEIFSAMVTTSGNLSARHSGPQTGMPLFGLNPPEAQVRRTGRKPRFRSF